MMQQQNVVTQPAVRVIVYQILASLMLAQLHKFLRSETEQLFVSVSAREILLSNIVPHSWKREQCPFLPQMALSSG